ncbi:uncharacterized protein UHO2_06471 [Ustilago hordei]|uniref:uncharacterized protein n=1 Tax=Ustilago hordei TaxID=120017 RepID=UPI001A537956|nr:uncharacterized protein UHO2_06471 [Ustilago hordei]SYW77175.1 uncharacterized protein UHO2_06471 [Ustilago hordei]
MLNKGDKKDKSSPRQNRTDLLKPDLSPHKPVHPLGCDPLHGPSLPKHIVIILGVGPGLGISIAQVFASRGYITAILSRSKAEGEKLSAAFACDALNNESIASAVQEVAVHWKDKKIGTACYNASIRKRGPFLEQRLDQIKEAVQGSILGGFSFAQAVLRQMEKGGEGGSLLVTGATSSTRGREGFAGFAASKSGLRAMCQSIAREYGPKSIHVAHVIVDGLIESDTALEYLGMPKASRFPDGSALLPPQMAKTWLFLAQQHQSNWTFEMDLRPAREHW